MLLCLAVSNRDTNKTDPCLILAPHPFRLWLVTLNELRACSILSRSVRLNADCLAVVAASRGLGHQLQISSKALSEYFGVSVNVVEFRQYLQS